MKTELDRPPVIGEADVVSPPSRESQRLWFAFWKGIVSCGKYLLGVIFCQSLLGSILVVGWTYRLMQRSILKCWWQRSSRRREGESLSAHQDSRDPGHEHRHWPNWFVRQNFFLAVKRAPGTGMWKYVFQWIAASIHSLWLNLKIGLPGILNTWVLTLPGCVLWLFAWYDGWNNSFNKGYEQASVGPLTGLLGVLLFLAAMLYVPLAQARQASTGQWRSFYDFRLVWGLARRHWLACLMLATLYSFVSVPVMILKTAPIFFTQSNPAISDFTPAQILKHLNGYFFFATLLVFPSFVLLRLAAARIYAGGILAGVKAGHITVAALGELERQELQRLELIQFHPPRARQVLLRAASTASVWALRSVAVAAASFVWFTFVAQIFISEFFMVHPGIGWLNQPLVQLPWFHYIPPQVQNPGPEIVLTAFLILMIFAAVRLARRLAGSGRKPGRQQIDSMTLPALQ